MHDDSFHKHICLYFINIENHNLLEFKQANHQPELIVMFFTYHAQLLHLPAKFRFILSNDTQSVPGGPVFRDSNPA